MISNTRQTVTEWMHANAHCSLEVNAMPSRTKLTRTLLYLVFSSAVSLAAIQANGYLATWTAGMFLVGTLLVYGIDIHSIEAGPVTIEFEHDNGNE